ncbi:MAG: T9SS type A sorting domain-containing protein [Bacteroidota bacterium]
METTKKTLFTILLGIILSLNVISQVPCYTVANTYTFTFGLKKYRVVKELKTWTQAASCAVSDGGHLAEINSLAENTAVYNGILAAGVSSVYASVNDGGGIAYVWIGASDIAVEGTWRWDGDNNNSGIHYWTGQGAAGNNIGAIVGGNYNNWGRQYGTGPQMEPDNFQQNQDACAIALNGWPLNSGGYYGVSGQWNDINQNNSLFYVIEYPCILFTPAVGVNNPVCSGSSINFSTSITGTATPTYSWTGPNNYTSTAQNPSIANAAMLNSGIYTLTLINGNCSETNTINVNVSITPTLNISLSSTTLCAGQTATAVASGATSYTWVPGNLSGASQALSPTSTQVYTITGSNGSCASSTNKTLTVVVCTGIEEGIKNDLFVNAFPNPFKDELTIEVNEPSQITITNTLGQVVKTLNVNSKTILETNDLPKGNYVLSMKTQGGLRNVKLVKE